MSFTLNRSGRNIIKKVININNVPNLNNISATLGSTSNTNIANISTLSLNNIPILISGNDINRTSVIPGLSEPSKLLVLDENKNITNLNRIDCSTLIVNGETITLSTFQSNGTNDLYNSYLTNNQYGIATSNKALLLDSKNNIQNINELSLNTITYKDNIIISNDKFNPMKIKTLNDITPTIQLDNARYKYITGNNFYVTITGNNSFDTNSRFQNYNWSGICWSPELSLFVAVCKDTTSSFSTPPNNYRIIISKNGYAWTFINMGIDDSLNNIIWISKLQIFVIISNNNIYTSSNGITWSTQTIPINSTWSNLCWSNELNMCIVTNTINGIILYSSNCIDWKSTISTDTRQGLRKVVWSPELNLFVALSQTSNTNGFIISSNGINWTSIPSPNGASSIWNDIEWSSYLQMFVATSNAPLNRYMSYSYDGYNWFYSYHVNNTQITKLIWADELKLWIGFTSPSSGLIATSIDGKSWQYSTTLSTFNGTTTNIAWSPELSLFIVTFSNSNSGVRMLTIEPTLLNKKPNLLINKSYITQDLNTNYSGILTNSPNAPLEINSTSGNVLKLYNTLFSHNTTFTVTSTGQLDISSSSIINLSSDYSTYGLQLNGTLINTSISNLKTYLSNITNGIALSNKPVILDSNNNINGLNLISCTQLNINNNPIALNNHIYFTNTSIGNITPEKAIITDINNNILGFNNISLQKYKLANHEIYGEYNNNIIYYNAYKTNNKIDSLQTIFSQITSNVVTLSNFNGRWQDIVWSSKLQLYVGVCNGATGTLSSSRIGVSSNGINWTILTNVNIINIQLTTICYSNELSLFVAPGTNNQIYTSPDGYNWFSRYSPLNSISWKQIIWSSELSLFIALGIVSSTLHVVTSINGNIWDTTSTITSISSPFNASIVWSPVLSLFVIVCSHSTTPILYSNDGFNWSRANIINPSALQTSTSLLYKSIIWSSKLNMFLSFTSSTMSYYLYSYNGIEWYSNSFLTNYAIETAKWINELDIFIAITSNGILLYSNDGFVWNTISIPSSKHIFEWSSDLQQLLLFSSSTANGNLIHYSLPYKKFNKNNTLVSQMNNIVVNQQNGYVGISSLYSSQLNPSFQLQLSNDSAAKPSSSTWLVTSDSRLKENIENANLELCYNNFKNLNLVQYKWKDSNLTQLGWIAQDVENLYPKSISISNYKNIENCKFLNTDQINATLYGTLQYMIHNIENDSQELYNITNDLNNIETILNTIISE